MQKSVLISCLLLINLAFSSAVFLQKPTSKQFQIFAALQKVEMIDFGKKILDTIALQLQNKVPLAEVAKILNQLKEDLDNQQADADNQHQGDESNCRNETERLEGNIATAASVRDSSSEALKVLESDIASLHSSLLNIEKQLDVHAARLQAYNEARKRDNEAYNQRKIATLQVLEALELIVDRLSAIKPESTEEALLQLSKIGKSNPILSLVQVASTFSQESLENVISKLNALKDSLNASLANEEAQENKAVANFNALVSELEQAVSNLHNAHNSQSVELAQKLQAQEYHSKRFANAVAEYDFNVEEEKRLNESCENLRLIYQKNSAQRQSEIDTIVQVQNILATKLETMRDYLKERAEA